MFAFFGVSLLALFIYMFFFVYLTYLEYHICLNSIHQLNKAISNDSIIDILDDAYKGGRYQEVIKIGKQLSKPLWYTGKYELRLRIGYLLEAAAAQSSNYEVQAETLLEDCGWTNIRLGNQKEGIANIKRGLVVAEKIGNYALMAQGYRNLIDIHLGAASNNLNLRYIRKRDTTNFEEREKELGECKDCYEKAVSVANMIENENQKTELLGNIAYTISKYYLVIGDYETALSEVEKSWNYYNLIGNDDKIRR